MAGTKIGDLFVKLGMDLSEFDRGLQDAKKTLSSVSRDFTSMGTTLSLAFTAPLLAVSGFALKSSAGFESAMNKVEGLLKDFSNNSPQYLGTFKGEMDQLSKLAIKLGADTQYSAKQAADAMGELAAAGFTSTQVLSGMSGVLSLAAVGQMELADAAGIAAAVVGGFGISADHLTKVADVLAKASSVSAASVQDLGYSFKYIGPVAKAAGTSFNEVAAALSLLANAGIKGESAGTALRNLFQDLLKPSAQAADVMKDLGVKVTDATGKLLPLADILDEFNKKGLTLSDGFKIWGARFSDVIPLLSKGGDELRKLTADMEKSDGTAKKMADTFRRGLAGMWEEFTGSIETLGIAIGKIMQPAVEPIVKWLTTLANKLMSMAVEFKKLDPMIQGFVGGILAVTAAIGPLLITIGGIAGALGGLASAAGSGAAALASMGKGAVYLWEGLVTGVGMIKNITAALQMGMVGALTGAEMAMLKLGYAATGLAAAFAGWSLGTWLRNNIPAVREFGDAVGGMITRIPGLEGAVNRISGATGIMERAQSQGLYTIKKWEESLRNAGISVSQGGMSIEAYTNKLRGMVTELGNSRAAHSKVFSDAGTALNSIRTLQQELANVASKATIGITDKGATKAAIIEVENAMKQVHAIQQKINESVKAGKIDKKDQVAMEKQLADAMSFAKGTMAQLGVETGKTKVSMDGLTESKKKATEAAKKLQDQQEKLAAFQAKLQDVLEDLPKSFNAFAGIGEKLREVPKEFDKQAKSITALEEKLRDFRREIAKAPVEIQPAMKAMTLQLELQTKEMDRWLESMVRAHNNLEQMGKDLDQVTSGLERANIQAIKLPEFLQKAGGSDWANVAKPAYELGEAMKGFGMETQAALDAAAAKAGEFYDVMNASSVSVVAKQQALLKYLELQIEADTMAGKSTEALKQRYQQTATALEGMGIKVKGVAKETDEFTKALSNQISTIMDDLGKGITDAILTGKTLGEVLTNVWRESSKALMRFVTEFIVKGLIEELKNGILQTNALGTSLNKLWNSFKDMFSFGGGGGAPKVPTPGSPSTPGGAAGAGGGLLGTINMITGAVDAVSGVLQYLQGRRMEQDIGRIEVTSRGVLNQLIAIQETLNTYIPNLLNTQLLIPIKEILWEMLTGVSKATEGPGPAAPPPLRGADPGGGRGRGEGNPVQEIVNTLPDVTDALEDLTTYATRSGRALSSSTRGLARWDDRIDTGISRLDRINQTWVDTSLNFGGFNIATQNLGDKFEYISDQIEPPARKLEEIADTLSDFEKNIWSTSKILNSASLMMGEAVDEIGSSVRRMETSTLGTPGAFSFGNPGGAGAGLLSPTYPYGPGSPGYAPPSLMLYPQGSQPNFNVTITSQTPDGRAMGNAFVNSLRAHGVDL